MPQVSRISTLIKELTTSHVRLQNPSQQVQQQPSQTQVTRSGILRNVVSWLSSESIQEQPTQQQQPAQQASTPQTQTFQDNVNEFVELAARDDAWNEINLSQVGYWQLRRAAMLGIVYGSGRAMSKFQTRVMNLTKHDDRPVLRNKTFEYNRTFEEILEVWDKSYDLFTGYSHFAYATRRTQDTGFSMFEKFIRQVNNTRNYKAYSPSKPHSIKDFPGPGIVINGIKSKVFNPGFLEEQFSEEISAADSPYERVQKEYRKILVESEDDLRHTTFGLFRGIAVIRNPQIVIDKRRYALIVFNDHFHNDETQEIAYLIPDHYAERFFRDPYNKMNNQNIFYPKNYGNQYSRNVVNLTCPSVLGGMDKALPVGGIFYEGTKFYDKGGRAHVRDLLEFERIYGNRETWEPLEDGAVGHNHRTHMFGGYWNQNFDKRNLIPFKRAHDEITRAALLGYAQFDLLKEAFRIYCYGYDFDQNGKVKSKDDFRLLRQALEWRQSPRTEGEKPILLPVKRLHSAQIKPEMLREVGIIDTQNMICKRKKGFSIVPGLIPADEPITRDAWKDLCGNSEVKAWEDYLHEAYRNRADFMFAHPSVKPSILGIINEK